jgi:hypothetical protein
MPAKKNQSSPPSIAEPSTFPRVSVEVVEPSELTSLEVAEGERGELTEEELAERLHLERKVERAFYEAGTALRELRDRRLYRSTHKTFEDYCRDRFGFNRRHPYLLIEAAGVVDNLLAKCDPMDHILPANERQVRPLTRLEPERQVEVWQAAVEEASGKVPTARLVKTVVQRIRERTSVPNPYRVGEVCQILVKENPELRGKGGCWAVVMQVFELSCRVRLWDGDHQVKIEHLKSLDLSVGQQEEVRRLCDRLTRLRDVNSLDRGAYCLLFGLGKQTFLTPLEEKLLKVLEQEYRLAND